jgi:hypothetical protein
MKSESEVEDIFRLVEGGFAQFAYPAGGVCRVSAAARADIENVGKRVECWLSTPSMNAAFFQGMEPLMNMHEVEFCYRMRHPRHSLCIERTTARSDP